MTTYKALGASISFSVLAAGAFFIAPAFAADPLQVPGEYSTIQDAVDAAVAGDVIEISGTQVVTSPIVINKQLTIQGASGAEIDTTGGANVFTFNPGSEGSELKSLTLFKTDTAPDDAMVAVNANSITIDNNTFKSVFNIGDGQTVRGIVVSGVTGLDVHNNTFSHLRQPGYINNATGVIHDNEIDNTKGWVVVSESHITFTNNTWDNNQGDIAIIKDVPFTGVDNYADIVAISNANNGAVVEDQTLPTALLSVAYVDASAAAGGNGTQAAPYQAIQAGVDRVIAGGTVHVMDGAYSGGINVNKDGISLLGESEAGVVVTQNSATPFGQGISVNGVDNVTISNMTFNAPAGSPVSYSFQTYQSSGLTLSDLAFNGPGKATTPKFGGVDVNSSSNITISNVSAANYSKNGFSFTAKFTAGDTATQNVTLNNVTSDNNNWAGVAFYNTNSSGAAGSDIAGVTFGGVTTITNNTKGIEIVGTSDAQVAAVGAPQWGISGTSGSVELGSAVFSGNAQDIINYQTNGLDALAGTFGGITGDDMTGLQRTAEDGKIFDHLDIPALGLVSYYAPDTQAPVVTVAPVAGSLLSGTETFAITVTDDQPLDLSKLSHIWSYLYNSANLGASVTFAATANPDVATGTLTVDTTHLTDGNASLDVGRLQDAAGNYSGASDTYFRNYVIDNTAPTVSVTPMPADGDLSGTVTFNITINDAHPANSANNQIYVYLYNTDGSLKSGHKVDLSSGSGTFTVDTTALNDGGAWLDVGKLVDAAGNPTKDINHPSGLDSYFGEYTINNALALTAPTLISPVDGAVVDGASVTNEWSAVPGAAKYEYQSFSDVAGTQLRFDGMYTPTSKTATNIADGTVFYWRVRAIAADDSAGPWSNGGALWKITIDSNTNTAPTVPTLLSPANGATTNTNEFDFTWNPSTDTNGGPITYQFQSSMNPAETGGVLNNGLWTSQTPLTTPMIHSSGAADGTWYWQVRAQDTAGNWSGWSTIWSVKLDTSAPAPVVTTNSATNVTLADATLNGTNGDADGVGHSLWVSLAPFDTSSPAIPAGVYSTIDMKAIAAHADFSAALSSLTTSAITTGGATGVNLPAIAAGTTYYYAAWVNVGGTWYPGEVLSFTTGTPGGGNSAPTASDGSLSLPENTSGDITLNGSGSGTLTYSVVTGPSHGAVTIAGNIATYAPDTNYVGADLFTYKVNDGSSDSNAANVNIQVNAVAPVTHTITASAGANGSITPSGAVSVTDGADQAFTITPDAGFHVAGVLIDAVPTSTVTSYTFSDNDADHTISATFAANPQAQSFAAAQNRTNGSGGGSVLGATTGPSEGKGAQTGPGEVEGAETGPGECDNSPLITSFMRMGADNDKEQVKLLQAFLGGEMGASVPVTGLFDAQTDTSVRAFQLKYADEILAPWGLSEPTGWVYLLTQWKINAITCPTLDASKPDVKPLGQGGVGEGATSSAAVSSVAGSVTLPNAKTDGNAVDGAGDGTQTAAAANASSTPGWFGSFVGWLFGK